MSLSDESFSGETMTSWRVLLVAEHDEHAVTIARALAEARHDVLTRILPWGDIEGFVTQLRPDVVIVEVKLPTPALLMQLEKIVERKISIVVFTAQSDSDTTRAAVKTGVSAYVVDGLTPQRIPSILETAQMRFREFQVLRSERDHALSRLSERVVIERAKAILMRRRQLPESDAYRTLRRMAMDRGQRLGAVAETIVSAEEMLAKG
jgi:response regulator NasT